MPGLVPGSDLTRAFGADKPLSFPNAVFVRFAGIVAIPNRPDLRHRLLRRHFVVGRASEVQRPAEIVSSDEVGGAVAPRVGASLVAVSSSAFCCLVTSVRSHCRDSFSSSSTTAFTDKAASRDAPGRCRRRRGLGAGASRQAFAQPSGPCSRGRAVGGDCFLIVVCALVLAALGRSATRVARRDPLCGPS